MAEALKFLEAVEPIDIEIGDKKFQLREPTGFAVSAWRNAVGRKTVFDENGKPSGVRDGYAETELVLISACLWSIETSKLVSQESLKRYPNRILRELFALSMKISGLQDEEDEMNLEQLREKRNELTARIEELESAEKNDEATVSGFELPSV